MGKKSVVRTGRMLAAAVSAAVILLTGVTGALACGSMTVQAAEEERGRDSGASRIIRRGSGDSGENGDSGRQDAQQGGQDMPGTGAEEGWEILTEAELAQLTEVLDPSDVGFYLSTYTRPEEIKWKEVFYNGAGISLPDTDADYRQVCSRLEEEYGELYTGVTALRIADVAEFVEEKTGSDYSMAEWPLELEDDWEYFYGIDIAASLHGDTNYQPVRFIRGSRNDETYRLIYNISDPEMFFSARDFCVTLRITGRGWQYISNLPLDPDAPKQLASIRFCQSAAEAREAAGAIAEDRPVKEIELEWPEGDMEQDGPLYYAVVTALCDGVDIDVDQQDFSENGRRFLAKEAGMMKVARRQASVRLDRNESVILNVRITYLPVMRISACDGMRYGEYWIGMDIWNFVDYDAARLVRPRVITGYAQELYPLTDEALSSFLQGIWTASDPETGEQTAVLHVSRFRDMTLQPASGGEIEFWMGYQRLYAKPTEASDLMALKAYEDSTGLVPEYMMGYENGAGDYIVRMRQEGSEQVLTFIQANNGDAALGYLLDGPDSNRHVFEFRRTRGRQTWQTEYKRILSDKAFNAAAGADPAEPELFAGGCRGWYLYDIDKNGIPELILDMGSAEFDRCYEIYTIDTDGNAVFCPVNDDGEAPAASHGSAYSCPDGNGMIILQGHMGSERIRKVMLDGTRLYTEILLEEDMSEEDGRIEYVYPGDIVEGSSELPAFSPGVLLPVDTWEQWYGAWTGDAGAAEGRTDAGNAAIYHEEPDWFHAVQNVPDSVFLLCPSDPYVTGSGNTTVGWLLEQGVIYEYSPENLVVHDLTYADLNGDGLTEAVMHVGASDSEASLYRVIFSRQNGQVYAYSFLCGGDETVSADGTFICSDPYSSYRKKVLFDRSKCFEYPVND